MKTNPFLQAALFYALRLGWPVFPVKPRDKKPPLTPNGCLDASTDERQIREWWRKWPNANVAEHKIATIDFQFIKHRPPANHEQRSPF